MTSRAITILITILITATSGYSVEIDAVAGAAISASESGDTVHHQEFVPSGDWHQEDAEHKSRKLMERDFGRMTLAAALVPYTQDNYDVLFYDVYMRLNDTTESLFGRVKFVARSTQTNLTEILVDLWADRPVDSIIAPSGPLSYTRDGDLITITLDRPYDTEEQFEFDIWYCHVVNDYFGIAWSGGYVGSQSEPYWSPAWWPCKDELTDKPDSMKIAFEVDTSFYAASNGTLDSVVPAGENSHIYYYTEHHPIATYLFSVVAGHLWLLCQEYHYEGGAGPMPVVHAITPGMYDSAEVPVQITPGVLAVFAEYFGEYPFVDEKYGHANDPGGWAMENQTISTMSDDNLVKPEVIVHEVAHQWWGDMITCESWCDIWLNEGFASWSEGLYWRETMGEGVYNAYMNTLEYTGGGTVYCWDTTQIWRIFDPNLSFDKGAWVIYMLHYVLGEEVFFDGLRAYSDSPHKYGSATTEDFKNIMETSSGIELDRFFEQWIFGEYCPNYQYYYTSLPSDTGGYDVYVVIEQVQTTDPQVFEMPLELGLFREPLQGDTVRVLADKRRNHYKFNFETDLINYGVWLDPSNRVLSHKSYYDWTMFITTLAEELSEGLQDQPYNDTIELLGGSGDFTWSIVSGALPSGYSIDDQGIITGTTTETGTFEFTVEVADNIEPYTDQYPFSIYVVPSECCGEFSEGYTGNVNRSIDGKATLSDISLLIDHLFISKQELECPSDGNVNGSLDEKITLSDVSRLIDHVFISKDATEPCL